MRFLSLLGVALAAVIGANCASAGFVMIDDFAPPAEFPRVVVGNSITYVNGDLVVSNGTYQRITWELGGYDLLEAKGFVIKLKGMEVTDGVVDVRARVNGQLNAVTHTVSAGFNGSLEFDFRSLGPLQLGSVNTVRLQFGSFGNTDQFTYSLDNVQAVPEPTTMALIGLACSGGGVAGWRKRRQRLNAG